MYEEYLYITVHCSFRKMRYLIRYSAFFVVLFHYYQNMPLYFNLKQAMPLPALPVLRSELR